MRLQLLGGLWKAASLVLPVALIALVAAAAGAASPPPAVSPEQQHNLDAVNSYRAKVHAPPLSLDPTLNAFALAGSAQLMRDHKPHQHDIDNGPGGGLGKYWETQGDANGWPIVGWPTSPNVNATIDQILASMMSEPLPGPGKYNHHSIIIDPNHTSLGSGLVVDSVNGKLYFTNDFNP